MAVGLNIGRDSRHGSHVAEADGFSGVRVKHFLHYLPFPVTVWSNSS